MTPAFLLESDVNSDGDTRRVPAVVPLDGEGQDDVAVDDYGVDGPGPDGLLLPDDMQDGYWRLCTANAVDDVCTQLVVGP